MVSTLPRQFVAWWPETPLQSILRSALMVDELTISYLWMNDGPWIRWSSNDGGAEESAFNSLWGCCFYQLREVVCSLAEL